MLALSIRQPYAEEILRGIKRIEYRSRRATETVMGERFYLYAALRQAQGRPAEGRGIAQRFARLGCEVGQLPAGVLVGTARISHCTGKKGAYEWHLVDVKRLKRPRKPARQPQPRVSR